MTWIDTGAEGAEARLAARWLVKRCIDVDATFASVGPQALVTRRNGASQSQGCSVAEPIAELQSFRRLLEQYGLAGDPALFLLSDLVESRVLGLTPARAIAVVGPADAWQDSGTGDAKSALLDAVYRWLRDRVQDDLHHSEVSGGRPTEDYRSDEDVG